MTTLYRPVLIESAEQAETLPKGAVVFDGDPEDGDTYVRVGGDWHTNGYPGLLSEALDLGFAVTALVPIEAEEETRVTPEALHAAALETEARLDVARKHFTLPSQRDIPTARETRYVTRWENT